MTKTEAAYLAGLLDGGATFGIYHTGLYPTLVVSTVDRSLAQWLCQFGGKINVQIDNRGYSDRYQWRLGTAADLIPVLNAVQPFLIRKRNHAALLLAAASTDNRLKRQQIQKKLQFLNAPQAA